MKKYITLENKFYESFLVIDLDKINDEILPVNRKTGGGADKNQFFIQGRYFDVFKSFFPLVYKDREDQETGRNKARIKNYFNISSLFNDLDFVNKEITDEYDGDGLINKDDYFKGLISRSESQNLKTTFYIESEIANAQNGIGFKNWDEHFKSLVKIILLPTTQLKVYLFKNEDETCAYWEFKQDYIKVISNKSNEDTISDVKNTIFYGAPGTGKSHKVNKILNTLDPHFYERITFHPEFDNASFVGGYRPISKDLIYLNDDNSEYTEREVHYEFVPQVFTNIYVRAWNDLDSQFYLAIEEINRGNCAEIFGDIFQLLDRNSNYTVSPSNELKEYLNNALDNRNGINNGLKLPPNLSILATMNTSDQSLFPMDSAFKRRWDWEYIPICYDDVPENESFDYNVIIDEKHSFKWIDFIKNVNAAIKTNANLGMDKCIGNYFIKSNSKEITLKEFVNKAIFYLWNDVFKDEDSSDSIFEKGTTYEDFFPIETNGKTEVAKILKALKIEPTII